MKIPTTVSLLFFLAASSCFISRTSAQAPWECPSSCTGLDDCSSLEQLYQLIKCKMPSAGSEAYVEPSNELLSDWKGVVGSMMYGSCNAVLPKTLANYELGYMNGDDSNTKVYCVLATFIDSNQDGIIDSPFGTVIVNQSPAAAADLKDVSIDIPHPINDSRTGEQGLAIFQGTNARSLVISGSHRKANAASSCQDGYTYQVADAAHNTQHTFHASVMAIDDFYQFFNRDHTAIQFHGMGSSSCLGYDVFATNGFASSEVPGPDEKLQLLRTAFLSSAASNGMALSGSFSLPGGGETSCRLLGGSNTAARLLNGVSNENVCNTKATSYSQKFLHIEQKFAVRDPLLYQTWIDALNAVDFSDVDNMITDAPAAPVTVAPVIAAPVAVAPVTTAPTTGSAAFCFSGNTIVNVLRKGKTLMRYLQVGDVVEVADNEFEPVYAFGDRNEHEEGIEYLRLSPSNLELTINHMVFVHNRGAIPASMVQLGDRLVLHTTDKENINGSATIVTGIQKVLRTGAYAPFTPSGAIVVNGVLASTYVSFQGLHVLHLGATDRGMKTPLTYQWLAHSFQTPHRIWSYWLRMVILGHFQQGNDGVNIWVCGPLQMILWLLSLHNPVLMGVLLIPFMFALSIFVAIETLLATALYHDHVLFAIIATIVVLQTDGSFSRNSRCAAARSMHKLY